MKINNLLLTLILALFSITSYSAEMSQCNTEECRQYFKKYKNYARIGYADAMSALGEFYYHGYGTEKNLDKALKQFRKATKYGSYAAPVKVALLRLTEPNLRDTEEAIKYLKKAARMKHPDANFLLGMIYYSKTFGEYDIELSDKYLTKTYVLGHKFMNQFLDYMQSENRLIPDDFPKLTALLKNVEPKNKLKTVLLKSTKQQDKNAYVSPKNALSDNIEVVEINAPTLTAIFDQQFDIFDSSIPEKNSGTGTLIIGRTCDQMLSCKTVNKDDFKRMVGYMN